MVFVKQSNLFRPQPYAHYQYTGHYPAGAYTNHYQFAPHTSQQQLPASSSRQNTGQANSGIDTTDLATLNDALGSAGVDLRVSHIAFAYQNLCIYDVVQAEEESLQQRTYDQHQSYRPYEDRSRKQPLNPSFDTRFLSPTIREIATQHKVTKVPDDSVNYLALALRARLQDLITQMIAASHHRTDTQFDRPASLYEDGTPMWSIMVRSDVAKQLAALEKAEREDEMKVRRERKERAELAAQQAKDQAAQAAGGPMLSPDGGYDDGEGGMSKKKRKKDGPGVTARNMSEDVRKKMSNAVASQAAGLGGKYAWMNAANSPASATKMKATTPSTTTNAAASSPATPPAATAAAPASGWSRPYLSTKKSMSTPTPAEEDNRTAVTLRDALFVIEKERGHGGGRGASRGWA